MKIYSNIVPEDKVREIQKNTLEVISNSLEKSFGPKGSHTAIVKNTSKDGSYTSIEYTKDGYTIIKNMAFLNPIEKSVQNILTDSSFFVVKEVGDGTTSAIMLSKQLFDEMNSNESLKGKCPSDITTKFHECIELATERIMNKAKECTLDDIYKIALISTNNNVDISKSLVNVYEKYGMDAYIDVGTAIGIDNIVKEYDGMTLETGFTDMCFVNNKEDNTCIINNPSVYCFDDPIDTPEMFGLLERIIDSNIIRGLNPSSPYEVQPTVILCRYISSDTSDYFKTIVQLMNQKPGIPLLIVSDIHQDYLYEDIIQMLGAPVIKKYINEDLQKKAQEEGLAPTEENILSFCGHCDRIVSDQVKTKIINPEKMFKDEFKTEYSQEYYAHVQYLETQLQKSINDEDKIEVIARARKRLNNFKGNTVDFLVGGISISDRNNLKASVEDAVLNCRSAAENGVGYGANYMALSTVKEIMLDETVDDDIRTIASILYLSYRHLSMILYKSLYNDETKAYDIVTQSISEGCPLNIRTEEFDGTVLSSIKSDIAVLQTVDKILTLMFTCNQYLVQDPTYNLYVADEK